MDLESDGAILRIRRTAEPSGLRVEGEIDATTVNELSKALAAAIQAGDGDIRVNLGAVTFIDLAGLRVLAEAASGLSGGRALVLSPLPGHVGHLIRLVGWDAVPGLRLAAEEDR
ncbi:STAS domain-containing protein [Sphaerisporangium sp. NPDC088356]|uniref:STAS domain-containing protein n=1 Tax=Sphaerisporangium sp. NPDC088356 TaxID=3154871 RepID=UPI00342E6C98